MPAESPPITPTLSQVDRADVLCVQTSPIHGKGLYSRRAFSQGEQIYQIKGRRVTAEYDANFSEGPNWVGFGWHEWLIPEPTNPIVFTNHACCPNAIISQGLTVIALHDIGIGEEIVLDYSTTEADPFWQMRCFCQFSTCRKQVRAFSYFPDTRQRFYGQFLPEKFLEAARRVRKRHSPLS